MGLLDSILGSAEAKGDAATGGSNQLVGALGGLLTQNGGIQGLMNKFSQGGLGETFCSWVGLGENQAISADQIQQVLGSQQVTALAAKLGVDRAQASNFLADYLPKIVDGYLGASAWSESGVGADKAVLNTKAFREGDMWHLNGQKAFCTGAGHAAVRSPSPHIAQM